MHSVNIPKILLKGCVPAIYIAFLIYFVDLPTLIHHLTNASVLLVCFSVLLFPVITMVSSYRWWIICRQLGMAPPYKDLTEIAFVSWFLGILPIIATGSAAKIFYLKNAGESASKAAISITVEKMTEVLGLLLFGAIGLLYLPNGLIETRILVFYWAIVFALCMAAAFSGPFILTWLKRVLDRYVNRRFRHVGTQLGAVLIDWWSGFGAGAALIQLLLTTLINLLRVLVLFLLAMSLGVDASFMQILACRALIGLVNIIPISVNGLGTRDAVLFLVLPIWGVPSELALALGVAAFLWIILSQVISSIFWIKLPVPFKALGEFKNAIYVNDARNRNQ